MATATVPMTFITPDSTGTASMTVVSSTTFQEFPSLNSTTADGRWYWRGYVPDNYASGPSLITVYCANATTGVARLNQEFAVAKDGEDQDPTLTASTAQDITVPGTAYLQDRVTHTASIPTLEPGDITSAPSTASARTPTTPWPSPALLIAVLLGYTTT